MSRQKRDNGTFGGMWLPKMERLLRKWTILCPVLVLIISLCGTCFADESIDYLLLTGFVKSYDAGRGIIRIDVRSEGCVGLREFIVPEYAKEDLDQSLVNKKVQFHIKSISCERGRVYEMILER